MANLRVVPEIVPRHQGTYLVSRASAIFSRSFCGSSTVASRDAVRPLVRGSRGQGGRRSAAGTVLSPVQLKEDWLRSMSCPFPEKECRSTGGEDVEESGSCSSVDCVIGIDPDASGALALLRGDTAQVFDSPHLKVLVGKTLRKRLDARSIVQLLQSFGAPRGTTAYIEQSTPFPQDGKQGWWSGGYTYGLWVGILVASGFSVVPVQSRAWKNHFLLSGSPSCKDGSREAAIALFPSLGSQLKRKKDHGRAEALLIATYGQSQKIDMASRSMVYGQQYRDRLHHFIEQPAGDRDGDSKP